MTFRPMQSALEAGSTHTFWRLFTNLMVIGKCHLLVWNLQRYSEFRVHYHSILWTRNISSLLKVFCQTFWAMFLLNFTEKCTWNMITFEIFAQALYSIAWLKIVKFNDFDTIYISWSLSLPVLFSNDFGTWK